MNCAGLYRRLLESLLSTPHPNFVRLFAFAILNVGLVKSVSTSSFLDA